jgi:hypothetical protein
MYRYELTQLAGPGRKACAAASGKIIKGWRKPG